MDVAEICGSNTNTSMHGDLKRFFGIDTTKHSWRSFLIERFTMADVSLTQGLPGSDLQSVRWLWLIRKSNVVLLLA